MALHTGLWIGINADADRAVLRLGNLLYHTPNQALHYRKFTQGYYYLNVLNDPARAVPYLHSALAQAPPDTFAVGRMYKKRYLGFLATALVATEHYAEAIATSRQAIAVDPRDGLLYGVLGTALISAGDADGAVVAYRRALALGHNTAPLNVSFGQAAFLYGDIAESTRAYQRALATDPAQRTARVNLGWNLYLQGDLSGAIA